MDKFDLWDSIVVKTNLQFSIYCDSATILAKEYNQVYNGKSRHLGDIHYMIRELIMTVVILTKFVRMLQNSVDHFSKILTKDLVYNYAIGMQLKNIYYYNYETSNSSLILH